MLLLEGAEVRFGPATALAGIDLEVRDGEVVAVLGPSGCGKTTLLRAIAGLVPLHAGAVVLDGRDLAPVPTHERGIGLMFQDYALFPHRDVGGNVEFGLRMQGQARAARAARVAEVLALVGLSGYEDRVVSTLSGGERQRVALARALAPAPRVLMLDEPFGALDRELRERLLVELAELFDRLAISVVYVTHDQGEALALADQVVVMDRGRVAERGAPSEVWTAPADATVARFLGFTNLFPGEVREGAVALAWGGQLATTTADGPATVLVRPDSVRIRDVGAGPEAADAADVAVVEASVFRGDHLELVLRLATGQALVARVAATAGRPVGTRVRLRVDPAGTQLL